MCRAGEAGGWVEHHTNVILGVPEAAGVDKQTRHQTQQPAVTAHAESRRRAQPEPQHRHRGAGCPNEVSRYEPETRVCVAQSIRVYDDAIE